MKKIFRLSTLCVALISVPFFMMSTNAFSRGYSSYDHGYDNGFDDGYDEAMYDCPCPPWYYLRSGFYLGAGLGYEGYQVMRRPWILDDRIGTLSTHANGWNGRVLGGYGNYYHNFYLGGEVYLGGTTAHGSDSINRMLQYNGKFSAGTSVGESILPGYRFTQNGPLVYARLGLVQTSLKASDWSGTLGSSSSKWVNAFDTGLGVEIPLYKNFSGRLEYNYIKYSSFNNNGSTTGSNNSPSDNRGSLDFIYHFKG